MDRSTLAAHAEQYLAVKSALGRSERTIRAYRQRLDIFLTWLDDRTLSRATMRAYLVELDGRGLSEISIAGYMRDVSTFCSWLVEEELLDKNPARKLTPTVASRKPASYQKAHLDALLTVANERDRAIILTLLDTGLRLSELVTMRRDRIDWEQGRFTVIGKGNKERTGWLDERSLDAIHSYMHTRRDPYPELWVGRQGPLTWSGVYIAIERCCEHAGIRGNVKRLLHSFRATFAKHYVMRGGDLESLSKLLGHSTIKMSAYYAQLDESELEAQKRRVSPLSQVLD